MKRVSLERCHLTSGASRRLLASRKWRWTTRVTSSTIVSQSLSLTPMNMNNVSSHVDLSPDTLPISSQTTMIHPRRGTTVLMLAHLSFDLPVPRPARRCRPVLTYRVSSGCDSTVFAPAPLASVRTSNFGGMQEAASCPCGHPTQTVEHVVTDCVLLKSPGDLTALRCPNAETRSWLSELPIEL